MLDCKVVSARLDPIDVEIHRIRLVNLLRKTRHLVSIDDQRILVADNLHDYAVPILLVVDN